MVGHSYALDSICVLVCVELCSDPAVCVALPGASVELFVPSRRAPGGCQSYSSLSQQIGLSCPMGDGNGGSCAVWGHGGLALPADMSHGKGNKSSETTLLSLDPLVILRENSRRSQVITSECD